MKAGFILLARQAPSRIGDTITINELLGVITLSLEGGVTWLGISHGLEEVKPDGMPSMPFGNLAEMFVRKGTFIYRCKRILFVDASVAKGHLSTSIRYGFS